MALPLSPSTTYVPGGNPFKAQDLNDLQKYLSGLYSYLYSVKGLATDRTGGATLAAFTADTPSLTHADSGGNIRHVVDHNGYPMGRRSEFVESWDGVLANWGNGLVTPASSSLIRWQTNQTASPAATGAIIQPTTTLPYRSLQFAVSGDTPGAAAYKALSTIGTPGSTSGLINFGPTFLSFVAEWEMSLDAIYSTTRQTRLFIGLTDQLNPSGRDTGGANDQALIGFFRPAATQHWLSVTQVRGGAIHNTDLAYNFAANEMIRCRMEIHRSGSPYGTNTLRFFINESLLATETLIDTTNPLYFEAQIFITGGVSNSASWIVSPIRMTWNRMLSLPAL